MEEFKKVSSKKVLTLCFS